MRLPTLETLRLVDHHCHGLVRRELDRAGFERVLTESDQPAPAGTTFFDSQLGLAVRRWCAPVLDLPEHAPPEDYLARRAELGADEVAARMLRAAGIGEFCVDTGYLPERLTSSTELAALAGGRAYDVLRLEPVAEQVALDIVTGQVGVAHFPDLVRSRLAERAAAPVTDTAPRVVAAKSVAAYRVGLALPAGHPADREVVAAVRAWVGRLRAGAPIRLADPVLHSFLIWTAADQGLPIQIHTGFGDTDLHLAQCNPLLLTDLLRALTPTGTPVLLLHCYPFHREAGYLAQVFTHVYLDIGLTTHNLGRGSAAVLAEALELAPFGKLLFSTDAFALAELYLLGALLFRRGLDRFLGDGVADGDWTRQDAERIAQMICVGNARRVYRLAPQPAGTRAGAAATAREPAAAATSPRRRARAGQMPATSGIPAAVAAAAAERGRGGDRQATGSRAGRATDRPSAPAQAADDG